MSRFLAVGVCLAALSVLLFAATASADSDDQAAITGVKAGYNFVDSVISAVYEEHSDISVYHVAAYGGYDFGLFDVTGTLWNYTMNIEDGVWRVNGDNVIDQSYLDAGGNGAFGVSADIFFDIEVAKDRVFFNPGLGVGFLYMYGQLDQYDYQTNATAAGTSEANLDQSQVEVDPTSKSEFPRMLPQIHVDLDWKFYFDDNWFATVNLGFQTLGFNAGAGFGYHF